MLGIRMDCLQVYDEISEDPHESIAENHTKSLTGTINIHVPALKKWILSFISDSELREQYDGKVHKQY